MQTFLHMTFSTPGARSFQIGATPTLVTLPRLCRALYVGRWAQIHQLPTRDEGLFSREGLSEQWVTRGVIYRARCRVVMASGAASGARRPVTAAPAYQTPRTLTAPTVMPPLAEASRRLGPFTLQLTKQNTSVETPVPKADSHLQSSPQPDRPERCSAGAKFYTRLQHACAVGTSRALSSAHRRVTSCV